MIDYPMMQPVSTTSDIISVFNGYNHNIQIDKGYLYDMQNMSSDRYPVLSPRKKRGIFAEPENCQGLIAKDTLCWVDGSKFVVDGYELELGLSTREEDCPKNLISMGAYVIIMPDKKYVNTADLTDYGGIEAVVQTEATESISFTLCQQDGVDYGETIVSNTPPAAPENGQLWIDTSSTPHSLKIYSEAQEEWTTIGVTYIKITYPNIGMAFQEFDTVKISGLTGVENPDIAAIDGTFSLWAVSQNYIVVVGLLERVETIQAAMTVERRMPNMDYVIEANNRLWGCRYGVASNGQIVNEIYASVQGDFKNWNTFLGIATDAYAASVGTDGRWTGAANYLGYPTFFKENCIHKVYGTQPSNFQIQDTACRGVQRGSERSLALCNETLFYKSRTGVCMYDGSLPTEISYPLGETHYQNAVGGSHANKYYLSMSDDSGAYHLFVYDAQKGMWHREDNVKALGWASARQEMYYIDGDTGRIMTIGGSGTPEEGKIEWMAETGELGVTRSSGSYTVQFPEEKYISRITMRMSMEQGAELDVQLQYDSSGIWEQAAHLECTTMRSYSFPIRPRRCDHLKMRVKGKGDVRIFSICSTIEGGSEERNHNGQYLGG